MEEAALYASFLPPDEATRNGSDGWRIAIPLVGIEIDSNSARFAK
jgi:hypothetical protein